MEKNSDSIKKIMGESTHDNHVYGLLHMLRLSNHDATKWEAELFRVPVGEGMPEYCFSIPDKIIREAVYSAVLNVESHYEEFVCVHQIPEVLGAVANDFLEEGIRQIRSGNISVATELVETANTLAVSIVEAQTTLAECLTTSEYHLFRENLGVASGTHSLVIAQHMFKDLYECLWKDIETWMTKNTSFSESISLLTNKRHIDYQSWLGHRLLNAALKTHQLHQEWRHVHLNLVRNVLGSGGTKSKIGVPDALKTVYALRTASNANPALKKIYASKSITQESLIKEGSIATHNASEHSLDSKLNALTGVIARDKFPEVQDYAPCPFKSNQPPRKP